MTVTKVFLTAGLLLATFAKANTPEIVNMPLTGAYIPIGFDDNDRVQVTVEGKFPNSCFKVASYSANVDAASQTIEVTQQAYKYAGTLCQQMIVPFAQTLSVGIIPAGNYKLVDAVSKKVLGELPIAHTKSLEADDFLYAPVNDAFITSDGPTPTTLVLMGSFPDRCTEFSDVRVDVQKKSIVVQPIIKRDQTCTPEKTAFFKRVDLKEKIRGQYLLHVRSLNGQAINKLVEIE